jgi:hypothetical protein
MKLTSLDASWRDRTSDPLYGTTEVQTDGCLCVMEMDVRFYFDLTM